MACVRGQAIARREPPFLERLVPGSGHKHVIVLGVECDARHAVPAMAIVSYTVTDTDRQRATGEGPPSGPIQVIALKMYLCPLKVAWHLPEGKCQTLMLSSYEPDTRMSLSRGLNAMEYTGPLPCQMSVTS